MGPAGMGTKRVVIIGGGFAGVKCARELARARTGAEVVLFNRDNHMVFQPLLADVAGSALNPRAVAAPLRQMLRDVECRSEEIEAIDSVARIVRWSGYGGRSQELGYDELVLALGNRVDLTRVPGMANHALPLKSVGDAIAMRARIMERLEQAESADDATLRRHLLSFVVIGGGFSGVEVAGEINDLVKDAARYFSHVDRADFRVTLVHSRAQILPEISPKLRDFALRRMEKAGVKFVLEARAAAVTARGVRLQDGREIDGATVICTVGNRAHELIHRLPVEHERGRLRTAPDMRVEGLEHVWAVGDCAAVPNAHDGTLSPPTAQFAERQGGQAAANIARVLGDQPTRPFSFKPVGVAAGIGARAGVAELYGIRFSGFLAWWLWRSAFLVKLPSFLQKLKVGFDWAWEVVFPRDLSHFQARTTPPVSRRFFAAGETIGDAGATEGQFYIIDQGECEIVEARPGGHDRVLVVLGRGELVGGRTLASFGADTEALVVRARTNTEVLALANGFLAEMSGVLRPLQAFIDRATLTHERLWEQLPQSFGQLESVTCDALMIPAPAVEIAPDANLIEALRRLRAADASMALILDEDQLVGILTRTDILLGLRRGPTAQVAEVMTRDPLVARAGEPAAVGATTMQDHGLKCLPVVKPGTRVPVGVLHADAIASWVLDHLPELAPTPAG